MIDREHLIKLIDDACAGCARYKAEDIADTLISEGVIVQSHGEWKKIQELYPRYVCTCCNHLYNNKEYKYCPFCGAKMDERSKENGE